MFKFFVLLTLSTLVLVNATDDTPQTGCGGCRTPLEGDDLKEAENLLKTSLSKLAAGDGPSFSLEKINSAYRQVVGGSKYGFNVDLNDSTSGHKNCDIDLIFLISNPNEVEVTYKCGDEEEVTKTHEA
ncbi:sarcocystatin-A-like [Haematobia irritans]|uniref:sarcocystatin-A-like n=1 Tax=Haematobia irritans TaxID=7368 RepID=UPI003F4F8345